MSKVVFEGVGVVTGEDLIEFTNSKCNSNPFLFTRWGDITLKFDDIPVVIEKRTNVRVTIEVIENE